MSVASGTAGTVLVLAVVVLKKGREEVLLLGLFSFSGVRDGGIWKVGRETDDETVDEALVLTPDAGISLVIVLAVCVV